MGIMTTEVGTIFDDGVAVPVLKQAQPGLDPHLAKRYRDAARDVNLEGADNLAKRLKPDRNDPRVIECRTFLQALTSARNDGLPVLFNVVMRKMVAAAHEGRGRCRFPERLFRCRTAFEINRGKGIRNALGRSFSVTPGKKGDFPMLPTVMGRLFVLNSLGYDIHVVANGMLFNHRCRMTCPWARVLIVELDDATMPEQERLLDAIRLMVAAAVFSGKRSVHMFIPLSRPIRNPHCVRSRDWQAFRLLKMSGGLNADFTVPDVEKAAEVLRKVVMDASGKDPDMRVMKNFASLTRAPGFRHGETGGLSRLIHADPKAKWDNPPSRSSIPEDDSPMAMAEWMRIARDWAGITDSGGLSDNVAEFSPASRARAGKRNDKGRGTEGTGNGGSNPTPWTNEDGEEDTPPYGSPSPHLSTPSSI